MVWDFAETNPFGDSVGDWMGSMVDSVHRGFASLPERRARHAFQSRRDVRRAVSFSTSPGLVATDPPYFAQIGYADLSDYFYVWHRRALRDVHPDLFAPIATPKDAELIAAPYRHGGDRDAATQYFVDGFTETFRVAYGRVRARSSDARRLRPSTGGERERRRHRATAWDAMLTAILDAGLRIVGTWPIHATGFSRQIGLGTNALASYVVLVCRPQLADAKVGDRQAFLSALRAELPRAIRKLRRLRSRRSTSGRRRSVRGWRSSRASPRHRACRGGDDRALGARADRPGAGEVLDEFVGDLDRRRGGR